MSERDIFAAARERTDSAARAAFLDEACGDDVTLRARVERLLQADNTPDSIFDAPAAHTPAVGDGVTRTIAPIVEEGDGPTCTLAPARNADDPDHADTKSPDEGFSDADVSALLTPSETEGSLGRLDHYDVLGIIGRGGMGVVLEAHDTKLRRVVAIKLLAPALAAVGTARKRFAREARSAAAVRDAHVVDIHAVCEDVAVPYLVMEFVNGTTLEDRIRAEGPLDPKEVVRIGLESARGLAAAHTQGLVHRDVKPGNILLEYGVGRVKLTDFGLARAADDASISRSGIIAGTPMYMSPEQAKGDQVDPRSDLFSLGSVLYTLCTGRPAFRAESTVAVLRRVCKETPRPIRDVNPDVPRWVCAVVEKLMAKDPADRIQTAAEVVDLFTKYLAHLQDPDRVPPPPAVRGVRASGRRFRQPILAALAVVAAMGLGVGGYQAFGPTDDTAGVVPADTTGEKAGGWKGATPEELAARPSPLDGRKREQIPAGLLALASGPARAPAELVAVLGDSRFRLTRLPPEGTHAEMRQDGEGKLLAVPNGKSVALFDAGTGERVGTLTSRTDPVHTVAFSPNGLHLAGATETDEKTPYSIKIWEIATGKEVASFQGAAGKSWTVSYSPDGKQLFCLGQKGLDVWDLETEKVTRSIPAGAGTAANPFYSLGISPDGKTLIWGDDSPKVKVWTIGSDDPPRLLDGHTTHIRFAEFSPDGQVLATGSDKELVLWDAEKLEPIKKINTPARWLAFESDGKSLLTSTCISNPDPGGHPVTRWNLSTFQGQPLPPLRPKPGHVQLSRDRKTLFFLVGDAQDKERRVQPYDAATAKPLFLAGHVGEVWAVAVSPDGRTIASGGTDGTVQLWDLAGWKAGDPQAPARAFTGHTATIYSVAFSPDGKLIASGSQDGTTRLWDVATAAVVRTLQGKTSKNATDVAFSADGKLVASGDEDGGVRLWDAATGEPQSPLRWHTQHVNSLAVSPNGRFLASAGLHDRKVHLTDLKTFRRVQTLGPGGDGKAEMRVAFGGDGRTLAYGGWDATVHLWDLSEKKETVLTGSAIGLDGLAVDPTGRFVAAARGGVVRFWDKNAPTRPAVISPGPFGITARHIAFTPEGRYLIVAGSNGTVSILRKPNLPPDDSGVPPALPPTFKNSIGMEFVLVPKGKSWLGGGKDKVGDREVDIEADFYLGKYEVTQEEWQTVMGGNPSAFSRNGPGKDAVKDIPDEDLKRFPVENMTWARCQQFVAKLNETAKETGWVYRLPTEMEWEYACRGGPMADRADSAFDFYFSRPTNTPLPEQANFARDNALNRTCKVGLYEANALGLHDMHGNVWEWCDSPEDVTRGGSMENEPARGRAGNTNLFQRSRTTGAVGLRLARVRSGVASTETMTPEAIATARAVLEEKLRREPQNAAPAAELAALLLGGDSQEPWTVLKATEVKSQGGAILTRLTDGSIRAGGVNPDRDTYTFVSRTDLPTIAAIRLEALTSPSLVNGGPGRSEWGNFALSEITVVAEPLTGMGKPVTLKLTNPRADFEQDKYPVAAAIDGNPGTAWSIDPQRGKNHVATFQVDPAQQAAFEGGAKLTVTLDFQFNIRHAIGRFRMSASADPAAADGGVVVADPKRFAASKITEPWAKLAAAYHIIGDQQALDGLIKLHPEAAVAVGDLSAAAGNWGIAIAEYLKLVTAKPNDAALVKKLAVAYQSAGRTRESIPHLVKASTANPSDTILSQTVAVLQAWFGQEQDLAATRRRILATAKGTTDPDTADRAAKAVCMTPSADKAELEEALALARTGAKFSKAQAYNLLSLGMAEYRNGNYAAADEALRNAAVLAGANAGKVPPWLPGISGFYRAMSLFKQGKPDAARELASGVAAKMKPYPTGEMTLLAVSGPDVVGNRFGDNLMVWLTYREAKALIQFPEETFANSSGLASLYLAEGKWELAVPLLSDVLSAQKSKLGPTHADSLLTVNRLAAAYMRSGHIDKSIALFEEAVKALAAEHGRDNLLTRSFAASLGSLYKQAGRVREAIPLLEEAHGSFGTSSMGNWVGLQLLEAYAKDGDEAKAVRLLPEVLGEVRNELPKDSPQLAGRLATLGLSLLQDNAFTVAEPVLRECLAIREKAEPDAWATFNTLSMLGGALLGQKKYADAEPLLRKGYEGMKAREKAIPPPAAGRRMPEALDRLVELYTATNKPDEVKKWRAERAKYPAERAPSPREKR